MKKFFENKPRAWFVVASVVVTILTLSGTAYFLLNNGEVALKEGVLAQVGDDEITQEELNEQLYGLGFLDDLTAYTEEEKTQMLDYLIEKSIIEQKAATLNIVATEEEINEAIDAGLETGPNKNDGLDQYSNYNEHQKTITLDNFRFKVLKPKVQESTLAWNVGKFIVFRYDRYNLDLDDEIRIKTESTQDYETKKSSLKTLALEKANTYAEKLRSGSEFYSIRDEVARDSQIGYPAIAPQTPFMSGTTSKAEYFLDEKNPNIPGFDSFNNQAFAVDPGSISEPFIITDDTGKELDYYLVYLSESKHDGYKWGYASWLESEKTRLLAQSSQKQTSLELKLASNIAYAAYGDPCGVSSHYYRYTVNTVYVARSGADVFIGYQPLNFNTGWAEAFCNGSTLQGYYNSATGVDHSYITNSGADGSLHIGTSGDDVVNGYVDCNKTTRFTINMPGHTVGLPGTIETGAYWTVQAGLPANSWVMSDAANWYITCLNNDTNPAGAGACTSYEATDTANGTTGWYTYRYYPNWIPYYTLTVTKNGTGTGSVTGTSINCDINNTDCTETWPATTQVVLTATPSSGSTFAGWSGGGCSGTGTCLVTMDASKTITATFNASAVGLSCSVSPASGPVPLVITVNATPINLPTNVFDYKFQLVGSTTPEELLGRGASIYYSLPSAGRYNAWVRNAGYLSNQWVSCTPAEVTVTDPTDSDGGEVAP